MQQIERDPTATVEEYFERMRARDIGVVDLFHEDACQIRSLTYFLASETDEA